MKKFINGFRFAFNGLAYTFRTQLNFKVEVLGAILVIGLGCFLELNTSEWLWVLSAITLVLLSELANTAIETLVDLVSPKFNPKAGIVKDIFAGVVLLAAFYALIVGILILVPKLFNAS